MSEPYREVAEEAHKTYQAIKAARKTMPTFTKAQRAELDAQVDALKAQWWEDVKHHFGVRDGSETSA